MKKNKQKILLILLFLILITVSTRVLADTLTVTTTAAQKEINIGDTTTVTVNWVENMQATDFILNYDNAKLKLKSTTVPEGNYVNENGKIKVMWYSSSQVAEEKKEFTFTFEGIVAGEAKVEFTVDGGFATGSLETPEEYNLEAAKTTITVLGANNEEGTQNGDSGSGNQNGGSGSGNQNGGSGTGNQNGDSGSGSQNGGSGSGSQNGGSGSGNQNGVTNEKNNATTNPTKKPTTIPKAGKTQLFSAFIILVIAIAVLANKLIKYKDI